jgi:hypothetical protein
MFVTKCNQNTNHLVGKHGCNKTRLISFENLQPHIVVNKFFVKFFTPGVLVLAHQLVRLTRGSIYQRGKPFTSVPAILVNNTTAR